jgi:ABC-type transporter Mla MlaB component
LQSKGAKMAIDRSTQDGGSVKAKRARLAKPNGEQNPARTIIEVERSGDWMPPEELRAAALGAVEAGSDVTLHLGGIDHLDASALQIVLALDAEQEEQGRHLHLANASAHLREWFEYAGVAEHFFPTE